MTKTNRKLALYRENKYMTEMNHPMMRNESPEYIVKLLMTKTNRKLALSIERLTHDRNESPNDEKRITRVHSKTTYDEN